MGVGRPSDTPKSRVADGDGVRAAEVVGALSLATDLATGQPLEHGLRTTVLAVRLGGLVGASHEDSLAIYWAALLHSAGCTSDGHQAAHLYGDDIAPRAAFALVDPGDPAAVMEFLRSHVDGGRSPKARAAMVEEVIPHALPAARETFAMHCEVARRFAGWFVLGPATQVALEHVFERWDGLGFPGQARGDAIPLPMRIVHVARGISVFLSSGGPGEARAVIRRRSGTAYEPRLAHVAVRHFDDLTAGVDAPGLWEQVLDAEPGPPLEIARERIDAAFAAIAAFTDLKTPWLREHLTGVADLAEAACWRAGLTAEEVALVRRAALTHDLGRVAVSKAIWEKPDPLGFGEWERVRLHPHFTERVYAQSGALAPIGRLAGAHHERLDGSGYHRSSAGDALDRACRILAAADCRCAMGEARPYRAALDDADAGDALSQAAAEGRLDPDAVDSPCSPRPAMPCAGARPPRLPAGLTGRELEVLRALAQDGSNQADGRRPRDLTQDRGAAHLREGGRAKPRRRNALGLRAGPRAHGIGRSSDAVMCNLGTDWRRPVHRKRSA